MKGSPTAFGEMSGEPSMGTGTMMARERQNGPAQG